MPVNSFRDLSVWQKSIELVAEVYKITAKFPRVEQFGLVSQMQRAAVSIPANIAEGYRRSHRPEYLQFLSISYGSGAELETHVEICKRIPHLSTLDYSKLEKLLDEVMRMLNVLRARLR